MPLFSIKIFWNYFTLIQVRGEDGTCIHRKKGMRVQNMTRTWENKV